MTTSTQSLHLRIPDPHGFAFRCWRDAVDNLIQAHGLGEGESLDELGVDLDTLREQFSQDICPADAARDIWLTVCPF